MTTTTYVLRPYSLGELLDQAIRLYRRNFITFLGIMAIIQIPISLLQLITTSFMFQGLSPSSFDSSTSAEQYATRMLGGSGATLLLSLLSFILVQGVATAALTRAVADNYLGRHTGILDAYSRIGSSWVKLVGAILLTLLVSLVLLIWTLVPCVGWVSGFGMLIFTAMAVYPLIAPIVVLEGRGGRTAIRRAWELARRRFWWILGFVFILYLFSQILISGPTLLASFLMQAAVGEASDPFGQVTVSTILQTLITLVMSLLYLPLQLTAITLLYFDLRVRTEGFDLAVLAREATGQPADVEALAVDVQAGPQARLITGNEFGYFVIISIGAAILYGLLVGVMFGLMTFLFGVMNAPLQ